jgi:hypothetical protein
MLKKNSQKLLSVVIAVSLVTAIFLGLGGVSADSTRYEYYNTGDDNYYGLPSKGQTFTVGAAAHTITGVKVKIGRGGGGYNIYAYIYATANGLPTGSALTSGSIPANDVVAGTDGAWYMINVTSYTLSANTMYALVIAYNQYVYWRVDTSSPTYSGGCAIDYSWENHTSWDYMFEVYGDTPWPPAGRPSVDDAFNYVVANLSIRIYFSNDSNDSFDRKLLDGTNYTFHEPPVSYQKGDANEYIGRVYRCDDCRFTNQIDGKADIIAPMYYSPNNVDNSSNLWGDVPVVVIDLMMCGAWNKTIYWNGAQLYQNDDICPYDSNSPQWDNYNNTGTNLYWLHVNLWTGQVGIPTTGLTGAPPGYRYWPN